LHHTLQADPRRWIWTGTRGRSYRSVVFNVLAWWRARRVDTTVETRAYLFLRHCNPSTMASTDRDLLLALFNATDGAFWKNKTSWGTDADLSQWHGVGINDQGRVGELTLSNND
ncbi:unnamed protein product, partial [Ectocarpus sp. 13 AM-2016]